ncbi:hypothetical protein [Polycladidibacter hongkongensis]|uniref:hypothetical protein n=1 Tax=Polycladidibacter hongkongensis TaxID=1647556 RepID=UPI00082BFE06|nr:hypothetical protein [Pseudovibrio hongkongensis]
MTIDELRIALREESGGRVSINVFSFSNGARVVLTLKFEGGKELQFEGESFEECRQQLFAKRSAPSVFD